MLPRVFERLIAAVALLAGLAILLGYGPAHAQTTPFTPSSFTVTPLATTTASATATLPNGSQSVLVQDVGSDAVFCALGATATTSGIYISPGGGFIFPTFGQTQMSCIDQTSTSTVNLIPGSGFSVVTSGGSGGTGTIPNPLPVSGTVATTAALGTYVAGYSPDMGNNGSVTPIGGQTLPSGTVTILNALAGIYSAQVGTNSHVNSAALEAGHIIKASAGTLFGFNCTAITGGTAGYCVAVNAVTAPTSGAIAPLDVCYFNTAAGCSLSRLPIGIPYGTGISIAISSNASPFVATTNVLTGYIEADYQ